MNSEQSLSDWVLLKIADADKSRNNQVDIRACKPQSGQPYFGAAIMSVKSVEA